MRTRSLAVLAAMVAFAACTGASSVPKGDVHADGLDRIRASVIAHAPYKQWDMATGRPNLEIGRAPGAACEAISYLALDARTTGSQEARGKAAALSAWIIGLQQTSKTLPVPGGVPSTPDLPAPQNAYHYSIDAAFCGLAMLDMADLTDDPAYADSAKTFGRFLSDMMRDGTAGKAPSAARGLCEAVVQPRGKPAAWDCRRFVKNLAVLPLLVRLETMDPSVGHAADARQIRKTLLPGLRGLWEWSEGPVTDPTWHRIVGPNGEKDRFVYGDTLAYALRGLTAYEGASAEVKRLYADFATPRRLDVRTKAYDSRHAYAGYVVADDRAADPASAYYDIVTIGILDPVRTVVAPADREAGRKDVLDMTSDARPIGWHMDMDRRVRRHGMTDASTLSAVGTTLIRTRTGR